MKKFLALILVITTLSIHSLTVFASNPSMVINAIEDNGIVTVNINITSPQLKTICVRLLYTNMTYINNSFKGKKLSANWENSKTTISNGKISIIGGDITDYYVANNTTVYTFKFKKTGNWTLDFTGTTASKRSYFSVGTVEYNNKTNASCFSLNIQKSSTFKENIYRFNYIQYSDLGETMKEQYFDFGTPSKTIVTTGKKNGLSKMIDAWNAVTGFINAVDDPTKIVDYTFEQKDVYEAIIMDLLETSTDIRIMECVNNGLTKDVKKLTDLVISDMKNSYNYVNLSAYKKICTMDDNFINQLKKTVTDDFKFEHGNASDISKISGFIGDTIKYANDLESYCEKLISYCDMLQMSGSMKSIVNEMYKECPYNNPSSKTALLECKTLINLGEKEFERAMVADFFGVVGKEVATIYFDKMWDSIKTKFMVTNPSAYALLAAYKTGMFITNTAFNTDTIAEKYYKLAAVNEVENLIKTVYNKTTSFVHQNKTEANAKTYNTMVDFMFKMLELDCKYSVDYLEETDSTLVSEIKKVFGNNDIEEAVEYVEDLKGKYDRFHESVIADWVLSLEANYPDLLPQYLPLLKNSIEKRKQYFIHCPVDVYIYDLDGNLVGSVENNVPYCSENADITISVCGDQKTIYMRNENEYNIVYKGNDTGTMDIIIKEYDETNSVSRSVNFNNIALTEGLTYTASEQGTASAESTYALSNEAEESIAPDYDTQTSGENSVFKAEIKRGYFVDTMAVSQDLHEGENVDIIAYIPEGYEFLCWSSDSEENIFEDINSTATKLKMPGYDVNIEAKIVAVPTLTVSDITENSVTFKALNCDKITTGTVILAVYNASGALEQLKTADYSSEFTFTDLKLTSGTAKIMIWNNIDDLTPLIKSTEKIFCFEEAETE